MRGFFAHLVPWVIVFILGFASGDRYGAPGWMTGIADKGFTPVENAIGGSLGGLMEKVTDAIPGGDEPADEPEAAPPAPAADDEPEADDTTMPEEAVITAGLPENRKLSVNDAALQIIKDSEVLNLEPYSSNGQTFIGFAHLISDEEDYASITAKQAEIILRKDVAKIEDGVRALLTRRASENEFSAMVSLAYSKGIVGFAGSDVLKQFNAGNEAAAADDFRNYTGPNGASPHLVERRERERRLFLK